MIPKERIEQIDREADMVRLAEGYTVLKLRGGTYVGLCPFHQEKTPSFTVSAVKNRYHCFGCGRGGKPIAFVMEAENLSFVEAAEKLAAELGIPLPAKTSRLREDAPETTSLQKCMLHARDVFMRNLRESPSASEYLEKRQFTRKDFEAFEIGYAANAWESLLNVSLAAGIETETLERCGLVKKSPKKTDTTIFSATGSFFRFETRGDFTWGLAADYSTERVPST